MTIRWTRSWRWLIGFFRRATRQAVAKRVTAGLSVALLLGIAGYSIYVAIVATATRGGKHYDPSIFWTAIGLFWVIAAASAWGAHRIYRSRFVKPS